MRAGAAYAAAHRRRRARDRATSTRMVLTAALLASVGTIIPLAGQGPASAASSAPGVSPTRITTGAIATLSGPLAADSYGLVPGVQAYFDMINARGGINGRRLDLAYPLDDGGNPSQFTSLTHALVDQDHVFAVAGVATVFFSPNYLAETGLPTYGYNVAGDWSGPPNLFASGGSVQCYTCVMPDFAYLINRSRSKSVALLAYGVAASRDACSTADTLFTKAGIRVSYVDLNVPIDGNVTPDVERMQRAGSDFVLSCMDVTNNISMARAINQYGMKVAQLWLDGNDQSVLNRVSEPDEGRLLLPSARAVRGADQVLPRPRAVPDGDAKVRASLHVRRVGDPGLGICSIVRRGSAGGWQPSHATAGDSSHQSDDRLHGWRSHDGHQFGGTRTPHRPSQIAGHSSVSSGSSSCLSSAAGTRSSCASEGASGVPILWRPRRGPRAPRWRCPSWHGKRNGRDPPVPAWREGSRHRGLEVSSWQVSCSGRAAQRRERPLPQIRAGREHRGAQNLHRLLIGASQFGEQSLYARCATPDPPSEAERATRACGPNGRDRRRPPLDGRHRRVRRLHPDESARHSFAIYDSPARNDVERVAQGHPANRAFRIHRFSPGASQHPHQWRLPRSVGQSEPGDRCRSSHRGGWFKRDGSTPRVPRHAGKGRRHLARLRELRGASTDRHAQHDLEVRVDTADRLGVRRPATNHLRSR